MKLGKYALLALVLTAWVSSTPTTVQAKPLTAELDHLLQSNKPVPTPNTSQDQALNEHQTVTVDSNTPTQNTYLDWNGQKKLIAVYNLYDTPFSLFLTKDRTATPASKFGQPVTEEQRRLFKGIQAYLNLILQKKMVEIARTNVMQVEEIQNYIASEIRDGNPLQDEYTQAAIRLENTHRILKTYLTSMEKGKKIYQSTFSHSPDLLTMKDPSFPSEVMPENIEEAVRLARLHHPVLQQISQHKKQWDQNSKSAMFVSMNVEERVRNAYGVTVSEHNHLQNLVHTEIKAHDAFNKSYELMNEGKAGIIDTLDSALHLMGIRIAITASDYAHRLANYQLLLATGQMNDKTAVNLIVDQKLDLSQLHTVHVEAPRPQKVEPDHNELTTIKPTSVDAKGYNDLAAFENAYGAPYSAELAPEPALSQTPSHSIQENTGYYLVLGSFSQQEGAHNRIQIAGMDNAFTKNVEINGQAFSRVLVGPMTEQDAKKSKQLAMKRGIKDSWILSE